VGPAAGDVHEDIDALATVTTPAASPQASSAAASSSGRTCVALRRPSHVLPPGGSTVPDTIGTSLRRQRTRTGAAISAALVPLQCPRVAGRGATVAVRDGPSQIDGLDRGVERPLRADRASARDPLVVFPSQLLPAANRYGSNKYDASSLVHPHPDRGMASSQVPGMLF
jgi:hypothetical protein